MDGDAAVGVAGDADHGRAAAEIEQVPLGQFAVDAAGRGGRETAGRGGDALVQRALLRR